MRYQLYMTMTGMMLAAFFIYTVSAFAGQPGRPMVISGEVLVDGAPVAEGTELKFMAAQTETSVKTKTSEGGMAYYRIVLASFDLNNPATPKFKDGDQVKFISLGQDSLADMAPVAWKPGAVVKNILVRTLVQESASILSAAATQGTDGKWVLKTKIRPVAPKKDGEAALAYRIKWLVRKSVTGPKDSNEPRSVKVAEETLPSVSTEKESALSFAGALKSAEVFDVCVTPLTVDAKSGPSVQKTVYPVLTKGEL